MTGLAAAFKAYGATGKNKRWSWSARTTDGETVVVTFWSDMIKFDGAGISYTNFGHAIRSWENRSGNRERIDNLKSARDHCGGKLRVVITVAKDPLARPREIADCYVRKDIVMMITDLNEETGEFAAVNAKA